MHDQDVSSYKSGVFITFSGDCKVALSFYQTCFGGQLNFNFFESAAADFPGRPVIIGALTSERIIIYGSDLVHDEGRKIGNHISVFLPCKHLDERTALMERLAPVRTSPLKHLEQTLIEVRDAFNVSWILSI